jgi:hypothetical protein
MIQQNDIESVLGQNPERLANASAMLDFDALFADCAGHAFSKERMVVYEQGSDRF